MPNLTQFLGLKQPVGTEQFNQDTYDNANYDLIDTAVELLYKPLYQIRSKNSGAQSAAGSFQTIAAWTTVEDASVDQSWVSYSSGVWTLNRAGLYRFEIFVSLDASGAGGRRLRILKSSTNVAQRGTVPNSAFPAWLLVTWEGVCAANDTLEAQCYQSSGGSLNYSTSSYENRATLRRLGDE